MCFNDSSVRELFRHGSTGYHIASEVCNVTVAVLVSSYEHLNPGHQRMVLGNRVRKILKGRPSNPVKA